MEVRHTIRQPRSVERNSRIGGMDAGQLMMEHRINAERRLKPPIDPTKYEVVEDGIRYSRLRFWSNCVIAIHDKRGVIHWSVVLDGKEVGSDSAENRAKAEKAAIQCLAAVCSDKQGVEAAAEWLDARYKYALLSGKGSGFSTTWKGFAGADYLRFRANMEAAVWAGEAKQYKWAVSIDGKRAAAGLAESRAKAEQAATDYLRTVCSDKSYIDRLGEMLSLKAKLMAIAGLGDRVGIGGLLV